MNNRKNKSVSAFSIILIILISLAILTQFLPIKNATISDVFMAPFYGFKNSIDTTIFVLLLGGFLGIITKTGSLYSGINSLINKLKGRELILIPILMFLFSIGGSTFGMSEETMPFYTLICIVMVNSGFDSLVAASIILIGSGVGVLGSTINPFSIGIAIESSKYVGIYPNKTLIIFLGLILWISSLIISIIYVTKYAKKVKYKKGSILSNAEIENMKNSFQENNIENIEFNKKHKITLLIFLFSFIVMVISLIPWTSYNIYIFQNWSYFLTGNSLGNWSLGDLSMWFTFIGIIIAYINNLSEKETIDAFISGAKDMLSVVLIISLARGVSVLMQSTNLDVYFLNIASQKLSTLPIYIYTIATYILYMFLSFFIPSTSGLASISIPILVPLTSKLGFSVETLIMIFSSSCGLINLFTPTSGVIMGGLSSSKVKYISYYKWIIKLIIILFILNILILSIAMIIL